MNSVNNSIGNNNFNGVARYYSFFKSLVFGNQLQLAESHFINSDFTGKSVLIVGGGEGEILKSILDQSPTRVVFVELSEAMLLKAKQKFQHQNIQFVTANFLTWNCTTQFDCIVFPFVLDLFSSTTVISFISKANSLFSDTHSKIYFTDFVNSKSWFNDFTIWLMYRFFGTLSGVEAKQIPDYNTAFKRSNMQQVSKATFRKGMIESRVYMST